MNTNHPDSNEPNPNSLHSKIYRYAEPNKPWAPASETQSLDEITAYIEKHIGPINMVFHELVSDMVHIDVHHVLPTEQRPFHTLVTSGMSDRPMNVPQELGLSPYAELMVVLPEYWQVSQESFADQKWYWPVALLKFLARFPHEYDTWLWYSHTMPNGDPAEPYCEDLAFNGVILLPPLQTPTDFGALEIDANKTINFFSIVPLYSQEMELKLNEGFDALIDRFDAHGINENFDPGRPNVAQ